MAKIAFLVCGEVSKNVLLVYAGVFLLNLFVHADAAMVCCLYVQV